jgi:hypothetical protein
VAVNTVLPIMARFVRQQVDRTGLQGQLNPIKAFFSSPAKRKCCGRSERDPYDLLEQGPIAMPAYTGTNVVANKKSLLEFPLKQRGKPRRAFTHRQQESRERFGWPKRPILEVITPTKSGCQPLARPLLKAEGFEIHFADFMYKELLLFFAQEVILVAKAGDRRGLKKIGSIGKGMHSTLDKADGNGFQPSGASQPDVGETSMSSPPKRRVRRCRVPFLFWH